MHPINIVVVDYLGTYSIPSPGIARTTFSGSKRQMHICHACSYYLCLSTSLTALHYSGSYVHSWVHVRLVVPVPRVLHRWNDPKMWVTGVHIIAVSVAPHDGDSSKLWPASTRRSRAYQEAALSRPSCCFKAGASERSPPLWPGINVALTL